MQKLIRLFLFSIMMAAIPFQAIATSSMVCNTTKHQKSEHVQADHAQHAAGEEHDSSTSPMDKCSSCASCCSGCTSCAMKAASTDVDVSTTPAEKTDLPSSYSGHISDGLERPPRFLSN